MFRDDVDGTYRRIRVRAAEILKERESNPAGAEGVEQIQLHAVDPGTTININVPPPEPTRHLRISYAVFCLKKKKTNYIITTTILTIAKHIYSKRTTTTESLDTT